MASSIASIERELWHSQGARKIIAANHKTLSNFLQYHTIHQRIRLSTYRRITLARHYIQHCFLDGDKNVSSGGILDQYLFSYFLRCPYLVIASVYYQKVLLFLNFVFFYRPSRHLKSSNHTDSRSLRPGLQSPLPKCPPVCCVL